jgi:glycosyltransferase involved in cell wall biosynthesis
MTIGFDVSYIQMKRAGIGRHSHQLVRSLLQHDPENQYLLHGWSYGIDHEAIKKVATTNTRLSIAKIPGVIKRFYWNSARVPTIESIVGPVQIFHSADPFLPPVKHARTICTVHDLAYKRFPELFEPQVLGWDSHVQRSVRRADAIVVPSEQTKSDVIDLLGVSADRIHVLRVPPSGVFTFESDSNDKVVRRGFRLERPYILFVGTIEPRKNISRLVHAFAALESVKRDEVDLVVIGKKGWLYDETFAGIAASPVKEQIHYLEYVNDNELAALYRGALCFVYPSLFEGYGFPVVEAMASGTPIITSLNSSLREIADGVALLVDPHQEEDIAEAMTMLIENEVRRMEMRLRGLEMVQQISSESVAAKVLSLYNGLGSS